jgi:HAD superfamily hydrolase (TIGR01484 family)
VRYRALATDYDGTLAFDGTVDRPTIAGLLRARDAGLRLVMVTGRELQDLLKVFPHTHLFDRLVVENGAVIFNPATADVRTLAPPPPPNLVEYLTERHAPLYVGHSIVATVKPHEQTVLAAIRELGLEWHVILNKGAVMVLPANVTKASGLNAALSELQIDAAETVGVGDAENDEVFLRMCGLSVAVGNALPALKHIADIVTDGSRGAGVVEAIDQLLANADGLR